MRKQLQQTEATANEDESPLAISPEKVCFIIMKAEEFDAKDEVTEPDPGSNPSDDKYLRCSRTTVTIPSSRRLHPR